MAKSRTEQHQFYCMQCGQPGIPLARRVSHQHKRFHRKVLYCINCHEDVNHIECKNEQDIREFKRNFRNGVYKDEAKESVCYVRNSRLR